MPRSFSGNSMGRRPDMQLFNVPKLAEKQFKDEPQEDKIACADGATLEVDELHKWVDDLLQGEEDKDAPVDVGDAMDTDAPYNPANAPTHKAPGSSPQLKAAETDSRMVSAFEQAMAWGRPEALNGFRPPAILSGRGAQVETGVAPTADTPARSFSEKLLGMMQAQQQQNATGAPAPAPAAPRQPSFASNGFGLAQGAAAAQAGVPPAQPGETVFVVRTSDTVVVSMHTRTVFGYSGGELLGQPLLSITPPGERAEMVHALGVLAKMDEIKKAFGGLSQVPGAAGNSIRLIHHVLVGLGRPYVRPGVVTIESTVTLVSGPAGAPSTCRITSRLAVGNDALRSFCMLPM